MTKVNKPEKVPVVCAIILKDKRVLATQRSEKMPLPGKWEFPGGKVRPEESDEMALAREIQEELQIEVSVHRYCGVSTWKDIELHGFICTMGEGEPRLAEHARYKWCNKEELETLDWAEADVPFVRQLLDNVGFWAT